MKTILGLDLGVGSVGWAVVKEEESIHIENLGSRVIPLSTDDTKEFNQGNAISKNASRTQKRTQRKGYDRYQQRRENLTKLLRELNILPDEELIKLSALLLWQLRGKAAYEKISLPELGRVLYHLNQKRGYKSSRKEQSNTNKKQTEYVQQINNRYGELLQIGKTIGQYFYEQLCADSFFRCKDRVFPRQAYIEEFDRIIECQKRFYPEILTDEIIDTLRNKIIYYQRSLKSCKHLVASCEFEKRTYINSNGKAVYNGPKVAPRSSPLFQICKIWESINNLDKNIRNKKNEELYMTHEQKQQIFEFMNTHEKLKLADLYKILGISKSDGWRGSKAIGNGLPGNTTQCAIAKALGKYPEKEKLLQFNLHVIETENVNTNTGEIIRIITTDFEQEPLYRLWHVLYSISEEQELRNILKRQFGIIDEEILSNLCAIDFTKDGYGNKSSKAIRRILPYLQEGFIYSEACDCAGFKHSNSLTVAENESRQLAARLTPIAKNELRQPVVEKILNQMINVVNAAIDSYGPFDEIRVELARELKQSREERNQTYQNMGRNQRENDAIANRIKNEYPGITPTRTRIQKFKLWEESQHRCIYCGNIVGVREFLAGYEVEVEHIIPKSLFFDDSFSNKACACRKCNQEKGNRTAYDYMSSKGEIQLNEYVERVNKYFKDKQISKTKLERLLTTAEKIPTDFIDRQLRESQYIACKAREILQTVCRNVTATSGSVTNFLRHIWGWDEVLHNLNFHRYKAFDPQNELELIETVKSEKSNKQTQQRIKEWTKRNDHRHHAIDALVIACTKQGYIQRLNNLSAFKDKTFNPDEKQGEEYQNKKTGLQRYIQEQPHPSTTEVMAAVDRILVSFKAGKRSATFGKRYIYRAGKRILVQKQIIIPKGALSEESVYGAINRYEKNRNGEVTLKQQSVIKYPLTNIGPKDVDSIVDKHIRELVRQRLETHAENIKSAFAEPLYSDKNGKMPIKSVRCFTGLSAVVPVRYDENSRPIGYVKPANNHHVAIYADRNGKLHEHIVTFWNAVERKKYGIPAIITHPEEVWDSIADNLPDSFLESLPDVTWTFQLSLQQNEMFILGMDEEQYQYAIEQKDYSLMNKYLYRVQKLSSGDYWFRFHTETTTDQTAVDQKIKRFYRTTINSLIKLNPHKVKISLLGKIIL